MDHPRLSEKSTAILSMIAQGYVYSQIIESRTDISYRDIYHAAEEALKMNEHESDHKERLAEIKNKHPKAYEKWTAEEDEMLSSMHQQGDSHAEIAEQLQRQPSAIRSRLAKLGFDGPEGNGR